VGLAWNSPIGPLKFSYAIPLNAIDADRIQRFQFQVGTVF
jgi:outer membrane protein insertion porin family